MNIDNAVAAISLIKERNKRGLLVFRELSRPFYYDQEFSEEHSPSIDRDLYIRGISATISYFFDKSYPSSYWEYLEYDSFLSIMNIFDLGINSIDPIVFAESEEDFIKGIKELMLKEGSVREAIRYINI